MLLNIPDKLENYNFLEEGSVLRLEPMKNQGLSNDTYLLINKNDRYVVKTFNNSLFSSKSKKLEFQIQNSAYKQNIAPKPVLLNIKSKIFMSSYQRGVHKTDISKSDLLALSKTLKILHKIKANYKPFNISLFFQKNCKKFDKKTKLALLAIKKYSKDLVLCHNDLNPQNILFSKRVKFIDWEFASINDRYFDIASVIVEFNLNKVKEKYFLHSYFKTKHIDTKRLKAYKILYKHLCKIWFDIISEKKE